MAKTFWDRWAGFYDFFEWTNVRGMVDAVARRVPAGASVLECAAGTGAISLAVAGKAAHVLCTDLSLPMLDRARAKAARLGAENVSFAARDLLDLSDPDEAYDVTVAANVLPLLDDPRPALREVWRVTRTGGLVILPTFLLGEAHWGFRQVIRLYRVFGFRPKHPFTRRNYQGLIDGCLPGKADYTLIRGRLSVGLAVLTKQ